MSEIPGLKQLYSSLRDGETNAVGLFEQCKLMLDTHCNLGAYKTSTPELGQHTAKAAVCALDAGSDLGLLQGIPVSLKDLYGVTDVPTFAGTPRELPKNWRSEGPLVAKLREQCAPIIGKTHTVEFAFGGLGVNSHWGTVRNPWDPEHHRVPGGSSAGAGVSLVEGSALVAYGTDTAGSVRIPASVTGTVGLKTSFGRWSLDGIVPLSPTLDTAGVLARTVADTVFSFAATDPWTSAPLDLVTKIESADLDGVCIGVGENLLWDDCDDGIAESVEQALRELESAGAILVDIKVPETAHAIDLLGKGNVVAAECDEFLQAKLPEWRDTLDQVVASRLRDGASITAGEYLARRRLLREISTSISEKFAHCDVIACPTVPITPPQVVEVDTVEKYRPKNMASLRNTCLANSASLCAITLPVDLDKQKMPIGLQLFGKFNMEEQLLAIAHAAEQTLGTSFDRLGKAPMCSRM